MESNLEGGPVIRSLSYLGFASPRIDDWRHFGPDILGTEMAPDGPDGAIRLRVDEAPWRLAIHPGTADDLLYVGWNVGDADFGGERRPPGWRSWAST